MTKQKIVIDESFIRNSSYEKYKYLTEYMVGGQDGNYNVPGISDYPFYAYFSTLVDNTTVLEIGTSLGGSAVMMSYNEKNNIISYDIVAHLKDNIDRSNIEFRVGNFMNDEIDYDQIDLMTLDASHTGRDEVQIFKYIEENWKGGLMYLDDIHNNNDGDMASFWNGIDRERHEVIDISHIGHNYHGSGLINFNRYFDLEIVGE